MIFRDGFGGQGEQGTGCIKDGKFANWQREVPSKACVGRSGKKAIEAFYSPEQLSKIISDSKDYDSFRNSLEMGPHGSVHVSIGGAEGEMTTMHSP